MRRTVAKIPRSGLSPVCGGRPPMLCAAVAAPCLIAPAAASARTPAPAAPMKVKGYALPRIATDGGAAVSLMVPAVKTAGTSQQMHSWTFHGAKVTVSGAKATIKGGLGRYGAIDANVKATGKA